MCGIAGIVDFRSRSQIVRRQVERMNAFLRHRGPDGCGVWSDPGGGVTLGHTRLAIIDLTQDGHQPMMSRSGRLVITYNGEVYNFKSLRTELERSGRSFRGLSDTEVILEAVEEWGLLSAVQRFVGMFAFTLWDGKTRQLTMVRDRVGKKPLYYSLSRGRLIFASELKALTTVDGFDTTIDQGALAQYFKFHYIPAPLSIYRGTSKLLPGSVLTVDCSGEPPSLRTPIRYWSPTTVLHSALEAPFSGSEEDAFQQTDYLLRDAVKLRMVSDVPIGAFLSGGVDSSAVAAHMQSISPIPIRTFSIGTLQGTYNEAQHASAVAQHLGTDHTEFYVEPADAMKVIPRLPWIYDEPFADSSQIPTYLVAQLARREVTVGLSGDGGDEVFLGYNRYLLADRLSSMMSRIPDGLARFANRACRRFSAAQWARLLDALRWALPAELRDSKADDRLVTLAGMLASEWPWGIYEALTRHWTNPPLSESLLSQGALQELEQHCPEETSGSSSGWSTLVRDMSAADQSTYLPDDILVKVDRASMAVSLEARAPLLDHRLIEFMAKLPVSMNIRHGAGKRLLRRSLYQFVPRSLIDRPKTGFGIPIDHWLRHELREWVEDLIAIPRLTAEGILDPIAVNSAWKRHLSGSGQQHHRLWSVLMFQSWLQNSRAAALQSTAACA